MNTDFSGLREAIASRKTVYLWDEETGAVDRLGLTYRRDGLYENPYQYELLHRAGRPVEITYSGENRIIKIRGKKEPQQNFYSDLDTAIERTENAYQAWTESRDEMQEAHGPYNWDWDEHYEKSPFAKS